MKVLVSRYTIRKGLLALGLMAATPVWAETIYNNLGAGNTFIVNREYDANADFLMTPFVTTGQGNLGTILTPVFSLDAPIAFGLYTNSGGVPGTLLESWNVPVPGFPGQLLTLTSVQNPFLAADTQYWFVISQTKGFEVAWYENNQNVEGGIWEGNNVNGPLLQFVPDMPIPALQLKSTTVPEPVSGVLLRGGVLILGISRARRRSL